jgi:uncharacterized membrane protein
MEQSLFAIIYEDGATSRKALAVFKKLHGLGHVKLERGAVVLRQADGQFTTEALRDFKVINPKYGLAGLAGTVAGLVGAAPLGPGALVMGAFMGAVTTTGALGWDFSQNKGLPPALLQKIEVAMPAPSAAVIVQVAVVNRAIVCQALGRLGGTLLPLSLNRELSVQLGAALAGEETPETAPPPPLVRPKAVVVSQKVPLEEPKHVPVSFNKVETDAPTVADEPRRVPVSFKSKA